MGLKTTAEINKLYSEHLESLQLSGLPFDEAGLRADWSKELANFEAEQRTLQGLPPLD